MALDKQNTDLQIQIPGMEMFKDLKFLQSETNPTDLVVQLPDGAEVVFPNYIALAQAGAPPAITLQDGTVIPGDEIVSLIANLDYDLIAPGAGGDTVGPVTGGGAGFLADPSGPLGDDIGHGPYAGGIRIADDVGFEQLPGATGDDGGGENDLPTEVAVEDNDGDSYRGIDFADYENPITFTFGNTVYYLNVPEVSEMDAVTVDRSEYASDFTITFTTFAPGGESPDWDGMKIEYLQAGDTITITADPGGPGVYYIALDTDGDPTNGSDPLPTGYDMPKGWEFWSLGGTITYLVPEDGFVYIGTGFGGTNNANPSDEGTYVTTITIDDDHKIEGSNGSDTLVSGSDADYLDGRAGDDELIGNGGNDVLVGGLGSDQYIYTDAASDGEDLVMGFDYDTTAGADNDIINLDALFDALDISTGSVSSRDVNVDNVNGDTVITAVYDGSTVADFSITLDDITLSYTELTTNGNIVVES
jgi:Ca2+-binding RTX toxin-like protein